MNIRGSMTSAGPGMKLRDAGCGERAHRELPLGADVPDADAQRHGDGRGRRISGVTSSPKSCKPEARAEGRADDLGRQSASGFGAVAGEHQP